MVLENRFTFWENVIHMQTLVSTKYQVVIPKEARKKVGIKPGQKMDVNVSGSQVILSPSETKKQLSWPEDYYKKLAGIWKSSEEIDRYLEEEDKSWD